MPTPYNAGTMTVFIVGVLSSLAATAISGTAVLLWKHREAVRDKLDDWRYEVHCFVFRPGRKGYNETASLPVVVVGRISAKHNPYTGEYETSRVDFKTDEARSRYMEYRRSLTQSTPSENRP